MKKLFHFIIIALLSVVSTKAQTTIGTDFWVTFGKNYTYAYNQVDLQIRIVGGDGTTHVTLEFADSSVPNDYFYVSPQQVYTYPLSPTQKQAVYNTNMGVWDTSVRITADHPVTAYALNQRQGTADATNVLPVTAL